VLEALIIF